MAKDMKEWPKLKTDDEVDAFVQGADLTQYDLTTGGMRMGDWLAQFEAKHKNASIHYRLPQDVLDAYRAESAASGIPAQRLMRLDMMSGREQRLKRVVR